METEEVIFDRFLYVPLYFVFQSPYPLLCLLYYVSQSGEVSTSSMVAPWRLMTFIKSNRQSSWLHPLFGTLASAIYRTSHFSDFLLTSLTFPSQIFSFFRLISVPHCILELEYIRLHLNLSFFCDIYIIIHTW